MDLLDFVEPEELLRFFHVNKTEMSLMENPQTFIRQLRDHDLIPEDRYQKMSRMKSKDNLQKALYEALDWLERKQSHHIKRFWGCVFKDIIINQYPALQLLRNSLKDGSFRLALQMLEKADKKETDKSKQKDLSEDEGEEEENINSATKKRKQRHKGACDDEQEHKRSSTPAKPAQRKKRKICFSPPLKKGEKGDIWTWAIYKHQLPITCGQQKGTLNRDKLAKGEKCIMADKQWFIPSEFEKFAGKESYKNWKMSIRCMDTPLGKLIKEGHLKAVNFKTGTEKAKKKLFESDHAITVSDSEDRHDEEEEDEEEDDDDDKENQDSSNSREASSATTEEEEEMEEQMEEEMEEQTEQQPEVSPSSSRGVFRVTCGALAGTLHPKRFASGTCGKSIRTETSWMTPLDFAKQALDQSDPSWKKDIKCNGEPLSVLTKANILKIHTLLCACTLCRPSSKDLENQKNDDECCICKNEKEEEQLVVCDHCPRAFHPKCHLPHVEEVMLGDRSEWMCTFCVFKNNQGCYYQDELTREAAMSCQISQRMLQCQYLLLYLCSADEEQTFTQNPNLYLSRYSRVIKTPMWLGKVADKLQKQLYKTVREFESDVQLIFANCASYNRDNAEFLTLGNRLKKLFDEEFNSVLNILV